MFIDTLHCLYLRIHWWASRFAPCLGSHEWYRHTHELCKCLCDVADLQSFGCMYTPECGTAGSCTGSTFRFWTSLHVDSLIVTLSYIPSSEVYLFPLSVSLLPESHKELWTSAFGAPVSVRNWICSGWCFLPLQQNSLFHVHCCGHTQNLEAVRHSLNIPSFELYHRILRLVEEQQGNIFREGEAPVVMIPSHCANSLCYWPWLWCTLLYSQSLTVSLAMGLVWAVG